MNFEKTLSDNDLHAIWAAMCAMTQDIHAPQDTMTDEQTAAADVLWTRLDAEINARHEAIKDIVALVGVPPGSIWVEAEVDGLPGCTWHMDEEGNTCSYGYDGPAWSPSGGRVKVLAQGLDEDSCRWVLRGADDNFGQPAFAALVRRRCAHLMAGGSIESYVETT